MAREIRCRDLGFDCPGVIRAENDEVLLKKVAEHARQAHGTVEVTPEMAAKVRAAIREV